MPKIAAVSLRLSLAILRVCSVAHFSISFIVLPIKKEAAVSPVIAWVASDGFDLALPS